MFLINKNLTPITNRWNHNTNMHLKLLPMKSARWSSVSQSVTFMFLPAWRQVLKISASWWPSGMFWTVTTIWWYWRLLLGRPSLHWDSIKVIIQMTCDVRYWAITSYCIEICWFFTQTVKQTVKYITKSPITLSSFESKNHHQFCWWNLQFTMLAHRCMCNMLFNDIARGHYNLDFTLTVSKPHSRPFLDTQWLGQGAKMITHSHGFTAQCLIIHSASHMYWNTQKSLTF